MGLESFNRKPATVREAIKGGDTDTLKAAGRKGAEAANRNRDLIQAATAAWTEKQVAYKAAEEAALRESTNEHILTANGEDTDLDTKTAD